MQYTKEIEVIDIVQDAINLKDAIEITKEINNKLKINNHPFVCAYFSKVVNKKNIYYEYIIEPLEKEKYDIISGVME